MGYIKSSDHFLNYLNKAIRESETSIDESKLLPGQFYVDHIYDRGMADDFAWAVRESGIEVLEERNVLAWISANAYQYIRKHDFKHVFESEFIELSRDLIDSTGIYSFWRDNGLCLYIGRSTSSLGQRMTASFKRFTSYNRPVYCKYIVVESAPDAILLEIYFISHLNPPFNHKDNFPDDELTVDIETVPEWSKPVLCNTISYEENGEDVL